VRGPYRIVWRVIASAAEAGYGNVNLATVEESTVAAAAAARAPR